MKGKSTRLLMLAIAAFALCITVAALNTGAPSDAGGGEYDLNGSTLTIKADIASVEVLDLTDDQWSAVKTLVINNDVATIAGGALQKGTGITSITAPYALKDSMAGFFGTTDFSGATITYNDGDFIHVVIGEGVTSIAKEYKGNTKLKSIVIASTVTTLNNQSFGNNGSFSGCTSLESVTFKGDSITVIPAYTFYNCVALKQIEIPQSVTDIMAYAFYQCTLTEIVLPDGITSVGNTAFANNSALKNVYAASSQIKEGVVLPDGLALVSQLFMNCTAIESVVVGTGSIDLINQGSIFQGCTSLKSVILPDTITKLGAYTFKDCTSMETIKLPASLLSIREGAFSGCTSLKTIDFNGTSPTYTTTNTNVFEGCISLENEIVSSDKKLIFAPRTTDGIYKVKDGVQTIITSAYGVCNNMTSITFADSVSFIEASAFSNCTQLSEIHNLPKYVEIGRNAFKGTALTESIILNDTLIFAPDVYEEYTIPESIRKIVDSAFEGNSNLKKVVFEGDMSYLTLGTNIFKDCTSLEEVVLPKGLAFMYTGMFMGCTSLKNIQLTDDITYIYAQAFSGTGIEELVIPESVMCIETSAFANCANLKAVVFEGDEIQFKTGTADSASVFANCPMLESVKLPSSMTYIPRQMFQNCTSLASLTWPDNLDHIDMSAFQNTGLSEIVLPEGIYYIGDNAFNGCTKVEKLVLPSTIGNSLCGSAYPVGVNCFRSLGTNTENGADVIINGCVNFTINASESKKNQFYGAKIHDLVIEECPIFGKTTFTNATFTGRIIVSGGSSFNLSNNLAGIKNLMQDGYLTVYVKNGDEYVEGKMMSFNLMGNNVDYNKSGDILTIPADVIAIPIMNIMPRLQFNGFVVDEGNPYFTVNGKELYFELVNNDPDKFEDAKLVYAIMKNVSGEGINDNIVVPEGVTKIGAYATYDMNFMTTSISLPSTIKTVEQMSIRNTWVTIIESDQALPKIEGGASGYVYIKPTMPQSVIDSFDPVPLYTGAVATISGYIYETSESTVALKMPLGSAIVDFKDNDTSVMFKIAPTEAYDRSVITVKVGDNVINPDDDGYYTVQKDSSVIRVIVDGLQINHYSIEAEESEAFSLAYSEVDISSIEADTSVAFTVTPNPGYEVQSTGLIVMINGAEAVMELISGRYYSEFTITDDTVITVTGIEPSNVYTVAFDTNGGGSVESQKIVGGCVAAIPEQPSKSGSLFFGWYLGGSLYDFAMPVTSDITLKAEWIPADTQRYTLKLDADNGTVFAISENTLEVLDSGAKVPAGTTVTVYFCPSWGYEARSWTVNGAQYRTISDEMTLTVLSDMAVAVSSEYTVSSFPYLETDTKAPTKNDVSKMIWKIRGTEGFNGMVYTPSIMGDYVYSCSGNDLFKISLATGELVKKVNTGSYASSYYNFTTVGNGYILVGYAGQVYDEDLNPVFNLHYGSAASDFGKIREEKVYYEDGYYYIFTDEKVYKFIAADLDETKNNTQYPVATGNAMYTHYISWYQGQSNLIFTDDFIIGIEYDGNKDQYRYLVTYDIDTLQAIDSYRFDGIEGANLNTGYISYYDGTVYFNTYSPNSNMFSTSNEKWYSISSVELDSDGRFNPATVHYYDLGTTSYPSSLIVVGDYGYINAGNNFYVIDMKTMTRAQFLPSSMSHGNMSVSVQGDKVYAYIIPYSGSAKIMIFEHDQTTNTLTNVSIANAVDTDEYCSQIIHFGPHGEILYYNDSGYLFCIAPQYTAKFVTNGGSAVGDVNFNISDKVELPVTERPGFWFAGWYDNPAFNGDAVRYIDAGSFGDRTYYAKFITMDDEALIDSVAIKQFIDGGQSVMLSVDAGTNAPEKVLVITYSAYVDLPEGTFLNPFLTDYVEMAADEDKAVFTPKDAPRVESITVTCCYEIESVLYSTPYAKAVSPTVYAMVDLTIDPVASLSLNGIQVSGGESMRYGYYTVSVEGEDDIQYLVNDIVADGNNRLFYYGQPLTVTKAEA